MRSNSHYLQKLIIEAVRVIRRHWCLIAHAIWAAFSPVINGIYMLQPSEIARHLSLVRHGIRTRLDEIKRREIDRLVDLHHRLDKVEHPQEPRQRANVFRFVLFTCNCFCFPVVFTIFLMTSLE